MLTTNQIRRVRQHRTVRLLAALSIAAGSVMVTASVADASGKPCDGCVGNADDKAPGGQSDGDDNHGYECDDNKGVGQGNPAHTRDCSTSSTATTQPTTTTTEAEITTTTTDESTTTETVLARHLTSSTRLPDTGSSTLELAVLGSGLIGVGMLARRKAMQ